jgi:multiple sugar transport system ATP-binding protein
MASLELVNLWKRYGATVAVRDVDLRIADGEFVALLGPSGCGKTSTMRMVAGLEDVSQGEIRFDGKSVNLVRPRDRRVAMAFENYALYATLNVNENVAFPLRARGWDDARVDARVREIASTMRLTELLERRTHELSAGQQQAVGLARALVRQPSVLLLDEPISHLDTRQRSEMRAYLKHLHQSLGTTMLYVTHDQEEAMAMSDRIAVMNEGRIVQVGTPTQVFDAPANVFVAGFIGEPPMNLVEVTADVGAGVLWHSGQRIPLPARYRAAFRTAGAPTELVLGVRPFHVGLGEPRPETLGAEIFVNEPLGDASVVTLRLDGARMVAVAPAGFPGRPGDPVGLELDPEHLQLFDRADGRALGKEPPT